MVTQLIDLRIESDQGLFASKIEKLRREYQSHPECSHHWTYFEKYFSWHGEITNPMHWSRAFSCGGPTTSVNIERCFRTLKEHVSSRQRQRLDTSFLQLSEVDSIMENKEWRRRDGVPNMSKSRAQVRFESCHPAGRLCETMKVVCSSEGREEVLFDRCKTVRARVEVCNNRKCEVTCPRCLDKGATACMHTYQCTCFAFGFRGCCQHVHYLAMEIRTLRAARSGFDSTIVYDPTTASQEGRFEVGATPTQDSSIISSSQPSAAAAGGQGDWPLEPSLVPPTATLRTTHKRIPAKKPSDWPLEPSSSPTNSSQRTAPKRNPEPSDWPFEPSSAQGTTTEAFCNRELAKETGVALQLAAHRAKTEEGRNEVGRLRRTLVAFNQGKQVPPRRRKGMSDDVIGQLPDLRYKKRGSGRRKGAGNLSREKDMIILYAISADPSSSLWGSLVAEERSELRGRVESSLGPEERAKFWELHQRAYKMHRCCVVCRTSSLDKHLSGLISCSECHGIVHRSCAGIKPGEGEDTETIKCPGCRSRALSRGGGSDSAFKTPWMTKK